jgi:hypothetical protein
MATSGIRWRFWGPRRQFEGLDLKILSTTLRTSIDPQNVKSRLPSPESKSSQLIAKLVYSISGPGIWDLDCKISSRLCWSKGALMTEGGINHPWSNISCSLSFLIKLWDFLIAMGNLAIHAMKILWIWLGNLMEKSSTTSRSQITKELIFIKVLQKAWTWLGPIFHDYNLKGHRSHIDELNKSIESWTLVNHLLTIYIRWFVLLQNTQDVWQFFSTHNWD